MPQATADGGEVSLASYEELRRHVLEGSRFRSQYGLVVLLREGMSSWMRDVTVRSTPVRAVSSSQPDTAQSFPSTELHVSIAHVLASMALSGREEMRA